MFKLDAQDSAQGHATFDREGRAALSWPDYARDPIMVFAAQRLHAWAAVVGGRIITEVGTWPLMPGMGVHPLGGCRMGKSLEDGVVDSYGRVFHPRGGHYRGLRIVDASIVPDAVGVPTSLTIAAVAERAAEQLLRELAA